MLMGSVFRAMGIDPKQMQEGFIAITGIINDTREALASFDRRMTEMETTAARVEAKLDLLLGYAQGKVLNYERVSERQHGNPGNGGSHNASGDAPNGTRG
jgi:hypothetical protein